MESSKKYEYILEQPEIREFCFYAFLEQFRYSKRAGLKIILLFVLCLIIMPRIAGWFAVLIVAVLLLSIVRTYTNIGKSISGQQWTVWLEGGMLKVDRGGSSEVFCSNIKLIRTTRRLLMLGYLKTEQRPAWIIVPLRVFAEVQERESFLDRIRHPQEIEGNDTEEEAEGICLTYTLDEMRWVDFRKGAVSIITSGTFGRKKRVRAVLLFGLWMMISMLVCLYLVEGYFSWVSAGYGLGIAVLVTVRFFSVIRRSRSESRLRSLLSETGSAVCGRLCCQSRAYVLGHLRACGVIMHGRSLSGLWRLGTHFTFFIKTRRIMRSLQRRVFRTGIRFPPCMSSVREKV